MKQQTLEIFCRQLACWADAAIAHGRFPFRKVEISPTLLCANAPLRPPLVFWINRDSFMAGGVMLLPKREAAPDLEMGRQCARTLGLRHFVTWSSREIVFWEERRGAVSPHRTIPFRTTPETEAGDFQKALGQVLEELKLLAVTGAIPPQELEAEYFANLCRGALRDSHTFLVKAYRAAEGEKRRQDQSPPAAQQAYRKGLLTLLRTLALLLFDQLPASVQPENLERAMRFAVESLPGDIRESLQPMQEELPLPAESAVRFHHLFRRLTQLRWAQEPLRARRVLEMLLEFEGGKVGGHPLPFSTEGEIRSELRIHPDRLYLDGEEVTEVAPAPVLAFTALLRNLTECPPAARQTSDLFDLPASDEPALVRGTLTDEGIPRSAERRILTARLRASWPTRRFAFPAKCPRWVWQFLHLLGLAGPQAVIELTLPGDWLRAEYGLFLWDQIHTQAALEILAQEPRGQVSLRLIKGLDHPVPATITGPEGSRQLPAGLSATAHRSLLTLALELSDRHFEPFANGSLRLVGEADWPEEREPEALLFTRSSWGSALWALITRDAPPPNRQNLRTTVLRYGLPLPSEENLENLHLLAPSDKEGEFDPHEVERELHRQLGSAPPMPNRREAKKKRWASGSASRRISATDALAREIARAVFVDGLPRFPEQYLYGYYRPQVTEYRFSGPLVAKEEFFGQTVLRDEKGELLRVENREAARALILASYSGRVPVVLPIDHQLTAAMVDRYLEDLRNLRQALAKQTHIRLADPKAAESLVGKIWQSHTLPPWELIDSSPAR